MDWTESEDQIFKALCRGTALTKPDEPTSNRRVGYSSVTGLSFEIHSPEIKLKLGELFISL